MDDALQYGTATSASRHLFIILPEKGRSMPESLQYRSRLKDIPFSHTP
jgi:hypothetical protein